MPASALPGRGGKIICLIRMRHETQADDIRHFMRELGVALRDEGRIYFTGGVSAVLHGWRQMTVDIDLRSEPEPAGFFEALHALNSALDHYETEAIAPGTAA